MPKPPTPADEKLEDVIFYQIELAVRLATRYTHAIFEAAEVNITKDQWLVLKKVKDEEKKGISPFEIATTLNKEPASMTRMLDILERKKMVERQPNPADRRSSLVFPTAAGSQVYHQLLPLIRKIRDQAVAGIGKEEIKVFRSVLKKMQNNMS